MVAKKKAAKRKGSKGRKGARKGAKASTAKRGAKRHTLTAGSIVKNKPGRKILAKHKLEVVGYKLGKRKAGKRKGKKK